MKIVTLPSALMLTVALCYAVFTSHAQSAEAVAKVNGKEIPQSRAEFVVKANSAQGQADTPDLRNRVREILIRNELLAQEATKKVSTRQPISLPKSTSIARRFWSTFTSRTTSKATRSAMTPLKPSTTARKPKPATRNTRPATFS